MMKNEELIKAVRYCVQHTNCDQCDFLISHNGRLICKAHGEKTLMLAIADSLEAIDRLFAQNTERCEGLRKQLVEAQESYEKHIAELEAEVERLKASNEELRERQTYIDHWGNKWMTSGKDVLTAAYNHGFFDGEQACNCGARMRK